MVCERRWSNAATSVTVTAADGANTNAVRPNANSWRWKYVVDANVGRATDRCQRNTTSHASNANATLTATANAVTLTAVITGDADNVTIEASDATNTNANDAAATGMSTAPAREVVATCTQSQSRMQAVSDLLLLSSDARPVTAESLAVFRDSYSKCRETVITRTKGLLVLTGRLNEQLHDVTTRWHDVRVGVTDVCELVVGLVECAAHAAYLVAVAQAQCVPAEPGVVDAYRLRRAHAEIELRAKQFKNLTLAELSPATLVTICSEVNKNLTVLTECCKTGSENSGDPFDQEQFRLCVKSFTTAASTLLSGIRSFKATPTQRHHRRCAAFYDALTASTGALVTFATEDAFLGKPAVLSPEGTEAKKAIFGSCLSVVSSVIQLCKVIRELAYKNPDQRDKVPSCIDAISKACSHLAEALVQGEDGSSGGGHTATGVHRGGGRGLSR